MRKVSRKDSFNVTIELSKIFRRWTGAGKASKRIKFAKKN